MIRSFCCQIILLMAGITIGRCVCIISTFMAINTSSCSMSQCQRETVMAESYRCPPGIFGMAIQTISRYFRQIMIRGSCCKIILLMAGVTIRSCIRIPAVLVTINTFSICMSLIEREDIMIKPCITPLK